LNLKPQQVIHSIKRLRL